MCRIFKSALMSLSLVLSAPVFADLVEDVEKLTPEQAIRIEQLLAAKRLKPIPESLFTDLAVGLSARASFVNAAEFNDSLDASYGSSFDGSFDILRDGEITLLWEVYDTLRIGLAFGGVNMSVSAESENAADTYVDVLLDSRFAHFMVSYEMMLAESWLLMPKLGLGVASTQVTSVTTDDGANSSYIYRYEGTGMSGSFSLAFLYALNPVFHLGLETGYQMRDVTELKRSGQTEINTPEDVALSGAFVGLNLFFNL